MIGTKLELLQMHTMGRKKGKVVEIIHKEVTLKVKAENCIEYEPSERRREVVVLCN